MQERGSAQVANRGAEGHRHYAAKVGGHGIGGHATQEVATTPKPLVMAGIVAMRRGPGGMIVVVYGGGGLLGGNYLQAGMHIAADQRQREQNNQTPDEEKPHVRINAH